MNKQTVTKYKVPYHKTARSEMISVSLPSNETLSMYKRYRFDCESAQQMLEESQKSIEEYKIRQEQKEYEEMNYYALYRRLSTLSILELVKQLFSVCSLKPNAKT